MASAHAFGWGVLIGAGWLTGFCSGLLGIGGGLIIIPALIAGLPMIGIQSAELAKVAMATSLTLIVPTALASTQAHAARRSIDWALWAAMAPSILAGGLLVSLFVQQLDASLLMILFVGFALLTAWRLLRQASAVTAEPIQLTIRGIVSMSVKGLIGGAFSTALGMGVAFFAVPALSRFVPVARAIGTASALALPMAAAGAAGYLFAPVPDGCNDCTGYVHLPTVAAVGVGAVLAAPLGAHLTQVLPTHRLRQLFALLLIGGAFSLLQKKLPELSAKAGAVVAVPLQLWSDAGRPATMPTWLAPTPVVISVQGVASLDPVSAAPPQPPESTPSSQHAESIGSEPVEEFADDEPPGLMPLPARSPSRARQRPSLTAGAMVGARKTRISHDDCLRKGAVRSAAGGRCAPSRQLESAAGQLTGAASPNLLRTLYGR